EHTGTDRPLCRVVGRLDAFDLHERPQRLAPLQDVPAGPFSLGHPTPTSRFPYTLHFLTKRTHIGAKTRSFQRAFAHPMPPRKHLMRLRQQGVTYLLCAAPTAAHRFKVP